MAMPARSAADGGMNIREIRSLLAPSPVKTELALRQAFICSLTLFVVQWYELPDPGLTVYFVFFLTKPDRVSSMKVDWVMTILITIIIGLTLVFTLFVLDKPIALVSVMALFSLVIMFLTASSKLVSAGAIFALMVSYSLASITSAPSGEIALRGLLHVWLFIAIPAGIALLVNMLIAPSPRRMVGQMLAEQLRFSAASLLDSKAFDANRFKSLTLKISEIDHLLKLAEKSPTCTLEDILALKKACLSSYEILVLTQLTQDYPEGSLPLYFRQSVSANLEQMAEILESGSYPIEIDLAHVDQLAPISQHLADKWVESLNGFAVVDARFVESSIPTTEKTPFFREDAFSNPEYVRYAFKTTVAAMFCYITYSLLDWDGIHTCMITCYIVALSSTAETIEKLSLRIAGCLIGAGLGLVCLLFIIPHLTSIGGLAILVFLGTAMAGWVAGSGPRIAYAGFQISLAFLMTVVQDSAPVFDLTIPRDRIIGILFGNVIVYAMFTQIWPQKVTDRVDPAIAAILRNLGRLLLIRNRVQRFSLLVSLQTQLANALQTIAIANYEATELATSDAWLENRRQIVTTVQTLQGAAYWLADEKIALNYHCARQFDRNAEILEYDQPITAFRVMKRFCSDYPRLGHKLPFTAWLYDELIALGLVGIERNCVQSSQSYIASCLKHYETV